jgi:hypothetical protein
MIMKAILFLVFSISTFYSIAQQGEWWKSDDSTAVSSNADTLMVETLEDENVEPGKIEIKKDKRIEKLIEFKSTTIPPATAPQVDGYRVQLFFDQDKTKVNEARAKVLEINPEYDTYIEYDAPNYNLLLGNFRTSLEAEKLRSELREHFPAAIIVDSRIYFPALVETK